MMEPDIKIDPEKFALSCVNSATGKPVPDKLEIYKNAYKLAKKLHAEESNKISNKIAEHLNKEYLS